MRIVPLDEIDVLINGVGRALIPIRAGGRLVRLQHMNAAIQAVQIPRLPVADILVQQQRLVLREKADGIDAGVDTVGKREINDAVLAAERNGGLCQLFGKGIQACTLTASQQHGDAFFHFFLPLLAPAARRRL